MHSEVPEGWQDCLFGDVVQIDWGDTSVTKKSYTEHGYIAFSAAGGDGHLPYFDYEKEGVVVSAIGANSGRVFWASGKWSAIKNTMVVFPKNGSSISKFIYYRAQLDGFWTIGGGAQPFIGLGNARKQKFPLPPLAEQERIAEILTSVDDSIRATERVIEQAQRVKRGLMEELLTGGLGSAAIERGEVPEGWDIKKLGEVAEFQNGFAFKPSDWVQSGKPIIRIQNLNGGNEFNYYDKEIDKKYLIKNGDLLFCWSGSRGTSFGARYWEGEDGWLNQHIFKCVPTEVVKRSYFYYLLDLMTIKIEQEAHGGAGLVHIKKSEMVKFKCSLPPLIEQERIAEILTSVDDEITANRNSVEQLQRVKRGLMDDLLTGKVRTV